MQFVPRIGFNSEGQTLYMSQYLKPHKWTYLRENIARSSSTQQRSGHFTISSGESKPRHVFVFIIDDANLDNQEANPFLYDTFSVSTDPRTMTEYHLEVGNGIEYPDLHYNLTEDLRRVYRDVLNFTHKNSEFGEGTLLTRTNFKTLTPFIYFHLKNNKQKADIKDGTVRLVFRYELLGTTATAYSIYALTLSEQLKTLNWFKKMVNCYLDKVYSISFMHFYVTYVIYKI